MGSDSISAPGSSMSRLLSAAQGGCEGLQEAGVQKPRALSPGACGLDSYESSIYTPAYGTSEMAVPWEVQWNHQELFCCLQRADGTKEKGHGAVNLVISAWTSFALKKANNALNSKE